jgi:hypothetical protein
MILTPNQTYGRDRETRIKEFHAYQILPRTERRKLARCNSKYRKEIYQLFFLDKIKLWKEIESESDVSYIK